MLIAVVIDRVVLGRAVVPNRNVAGPPGPAHRIFRRRDVRLEQLEQLLAVIFRQADEALDEIAEHERALAGFGMDTHHRMLGLVDGAGEHLVEMLPVRLRRPRLHGVVVGVAVDRPEPVGELAQRCRQVAISRRRIRPHGVTAIGRDHHAAQHRNFRIGVDEVDVGVPLIGTAANAAGVQFQDRGRAIGGADGRMRYKLAEPDRKALLLGIVALVAEEDDLVLEQHLVHGADDVVGQIARQFYVPDLGADPCRALDDVGARNDVVDGGRAAHVRGLSL
ncbi:protein of unknown function [Bradyrhizobium vignae]|uniref:Uncharacterized protein n=1 Tax=Bradyrhizobium vignae TaxID=1549949 RepID=A0A2U3Q8V0_9BRAD|nr:protein of unknown function [Bradyrhizobium vignae]